MLYEIAVEEPISCLGYTEQVERSLKMAAKISKIRADRAAARAKRESTSNDTRGLPIVRELRPD